MVGFGDCTKDFELRAFLGSRSHYQDVLVSIEKAFKEADIEIAFRQQEITIKRIDGLEQREEKVFPRSQAA